MVTEISYTTFMRSKSVPNMLTCLLSLDTFEISSIVASVFVAIVTFIPSRCLVKVGRHAQTDVRDL
jgi:hypothetical protein